MHSIQRESLFYGNILRKQTDYLSGICIVFILFFDNDRQASGNCSAILSRCTNRIKHCLANRKDCSFAAAGRRLNCCRRRHKVIHRLTHCPEHQTAADAAANGPGLASLPPILTSPHRKMTMTIPTMTQNTASRLIHQPKLSPTQYSMLDIAAPN